MKSKSHLEIFDPIENETDQHLTFNEKRMQSRLLVKRIIGNYHKIKKPIEAKELLKKG